MSMRNPQNERYTVEKEGRSAGSTRPATASAKPARKAAASVRIAAPKASSKGSKTFTRANASKEERKLAKNKQREEDNRRYSATTVLTSADEKYKQYRRWWWVLLISAVVFTALSWLTLSTGFGGQVFSVVTLVLAYAGIIGALVMDFTVIRKRRNLYRARVDSMSSKQIDHILEESYANDEAKRAAKKAKKEARKAGKSAEEAQAAYDAALEAALAEFKAKSAPVEKADDAKDKGKGKKGGSAKPEEEALTPGQKAAREFALSKR